MKKILLASFLFVSLLATAQAPQGISYQAVAFGTGGNPVTNGNVGVKISILDNSATGTAVYVETHTKATNAQGLFSLNIGQGTATTGTFSAINWGGNTKFLKVEVDPAGGTNYTIVGTNQLMSVPYALYANKINADGLAGIGTSVFKKSNFAVADDNKVHVFSNGTWYTKACSSYISADQVIGTNGNFAVIDDNNVHVFSNGTWSTKNCSSYVSTDEVLSSEGNFAIIDDNSVHAFSDGVWLTKTCSSYVSTDEVIASGGSFVVADDNQAHAFYNGAWVTKVCSAYISNDEIIISNTN